jgi:hypothetical protein
MLVSPITWISGLLNAARMAIASSASRTHMCDDRHQGGASRRLLCVSADSFSYSGIGVYDDSHGLPLLPHVDQYGCASGVGCCVSGSSKIDR